MKKHLSVKYQQRVIFFVLFLLFFNNPLSSGIVPKSNSNEEDTDALSVPSYLKPGDILFCDMKPEITNYLNNIGIGFFLSWPGRSNDHCAMYIGDNRFIEAAPYRIRLLRGNILGVVISPFWKIQLWATNFTYGSVETTQEIQDKAVSWAKTRLGRPYQLYFLGGANPNPNDASDPFSDHWYCSELIWAAYWNQGVKLIVDYGEHSYNASNVGSLLAADNIILYDNKAPIAKAGGPYNGYMDEQITFSTSKSTDTDGEIMKYHWDFGDGTSGYGEWNYHYYSHPGVYQVNLTIKDNGGSYATDTTTATISIRNRKPSDVEIIGNISGYVYDTLMYSFVATDDDNDTIQYFIDWDDGKKDTSDYIPCGICFNISHQWLKVGHYTINCEATDGEYSSSASFFVTIKEKNQVYPPIHPDESGFFLFIIFFIFVCGSFLLIVIKKRRI